MPVINCTLHTNSSTRSLNHGSCEPSVPSHLVATHTDPWFSGAVGGLCSEQVTGPTAYHVPLSLGTSARGHSWRSFQWGILMAASTPMNGVFRTKNLRQTSTEGRPWIDRRCRPAREKGCRGTSPAPILALFKLQRRLETGQLLCEPHGRLTLLPPLPVTTESSHIDPACIS